MPSQTPGLNQPINQQQITAPTETYKPQAEVQKPNNLQWINPDMIPFLKIATDIQETLKRIELKLDNLR